VLLVMVLLHGILWSALLSASAAYMTDLLPEKRRAEGISYWGIAGTLAIATAPAVGFWLYQWGWAAVCGAVALSNFAMVAVAWRLDEARAVAGTSGERFLSRNLLEWRVLATSPTLFLCSFGYGGITSFVALYAEANQVAPRGIYFTTFAVVMIVSRPTIGRLADRVGYRKVFLPCLGLVVLAMLLLSLGGTLPWLLVSAVIFGASFGSVFPIFMAIVMKHVAPTRRGAAFGGLLAAFDTGIGTGSIATGWMLDRIGFGGAFGVATALACLSVPYFLFADGRFLAADGSAPTDPASTA
jgi:MFS family permease